MKHNKQAWTIAVLFLLAGMSFAQINNGGSGGGGGVNPTSGKMPVNSGGSFADSPITVSGNNISLPGTVTSGASSGANGCYTYNGSVSGAVTVCAPNTAGTAHTENLPTGNGSSGNFLQTDGGAPAQLSWQPLLFNTATTTFTQLENSNSGAGGIWFNFATSGTTQITDIIGGASTAGNGDAGLRMGFEASNGAPQGARLQFFGNSATGGLAGNMYFDVATGSTINFRTNNTQVVFSISGTGLGGAANLLVGAAAPTISSGFGTSPSVANSNTTLAFTINVGTGGTATSGVIGFGTAAHGWAVNCTDITTNSSTVFITKQTATTTTTATIGNFNTSAAAAAWAASDILSCQASAY